MNVKLKNIRSLTVFCLTHIVVKTWLFTLCIFYYTSLPTNTSQTEIKQN